MKESEHLEINPDMIWANLRHILPIIENAKPGFTMSVIIHHSVASKSHIKTCYVDLMDFLAIKIIDNKEILAKHGIVITDDEFKYNSQDLFALLKKVCKRIDKLERKVFWYDEP